MENKGMSFKRRLGKTLFEMVLSVICVIGLSFFIIFFLYGNNIINSVNLKKELKVERIEDKEQSVEYLEKMRVNYVQFDKKGKVLNKYIANHNLILAKEAFRTKKVIKDSSGEYIPYLKGDSQIVVRIPFIPEFSDLELEEKEPFNNLFNKLIIIICLIVSIIPIINLIYQIKNEFLELEKVIIGSPEESLRKPQIIEIQKSIKSVKSMKKMLFNLIEKEKHQKKDLLYQTSALSHDIKTPLTIIKGNVGMLEYCENKDEERECIESIYSGIDTIENYLDKMIKYSKLSYFPENKSDVFLIDLIEEIQKSVQGYRSEIDFVVNNNIKNTNLSINCSKNNVERAVINILTNAFEYAKTKVVLDIELEDYLIFKIYNDGENIDSDLLNDLGKLFYSGDKGRNNKHYGIGLYFAKNVAHEHNGNLTYKNLDGGVKFILSLKL